MANLKKFLALLLTVACILTLAGCTEGWTEPPEEESTGDIILSGQKYSGKIVVNIILHPDGTVDCEANGEKSTGSWAAGTGDTAMTVNVVIKEDPVELKVIDTGTGYSVDFTPVPEMTLTGNYAAPAAKPITTLSGQKWGGKVTANIALYPDGTVEAESNGNQATGAWEPGTDGVAMIVRFTIKDIDVEMEVMDEGDKYTALYPVVADFTLVGYKNGEVTEVTEAATEAATEETKAEEPTETQAAAEATEAPTYPANSFVLNFTADINEQLGGTFSCEEAVWTAALGTEGSYAPTDSEDVLFSWVGSGKSKEMDFFANGTYEFRYTKMSLAERGTWTYQDGKLTAVSEAGREMPAERIPAEPEEAAIPANTFVLEFTADVNEQLGGTFSCEEAVWTAALGTEGSYVPTDSEDILFSWVGSGKSKEMDFFANGTYEFRFTKMDLAERGTWTYQDGTLTATSEAGRDMTAELTK